MMKQLSYILLLFLTLNFGYSQSKSDLELIRSNPRYEASFEKKRNVEYLFKHKKWYIKYNPVTAFFGGAMFLYQKHISVQIGANCPFELSCSNFSKTVITKYGFFKGIALTADRLTRCTRLAGIDLIPGVDYNTRTNKILDPLNGYKFKD
ncbi:MAG: membrane protein insertion efficiency factor YidD [Sphingobacteriaceae bacterium]|nr:membrane protein insertion efficiency factor YidD [Sphingobacteriaceae bacterium]